MVEVENYKLQPFDLAIQTGQLYLLDDTSHDVPFTGIRPKFGIPVKELNFELADRGIKLVTVVKRHAALIEKDFSFRTELRFGRRCRRFGGFTTRSMGQIELSMFRGDPRPRIYDCQIQFPRVGIVGYTSAYLLKGYINLTSVAELDPDFGGCLVRVCKLIDHEVPLGIVALMILKGRRANVNFFAVRSASSLYRLFL